jgi:hypothetical protein
MKQCVWVEPKETARIEFLERTEGGRLREFRAPQRLIRGSLRSRPTKLFRHHVVDARLNAARFVAFKLSPQCCGAFLC